MTLSKFIYILDSYKDIRRSVTRRGGSYHDYFRLPKPSFGLEWLFEMASILKSCMIGLIYFQNPIPIKGRGGKNLEKAEI